MDSSPDLSLKLRRGSSDSRDSFYMDFAQGIDSDIEDVVTQASGGALPAPPYQQQQTDTGVAPFCEGTCKTGSMRRKLKWRVTKSETDRSR
ncbi:hypothetical protein quinque_014575 [Culex quinquefasciatus]